MCIADPTHLLGGVNRLTDPYSWCPDQVTEFPHHIEEGQQQRISDCQVFQFAHVDGRDPETTLRVEIAPWSELRYDACSRLYVARMLRNNHSDLQAMCEVVNQLPSLGVSRYQLLSEEDFGNTCMHMAGCTELQFLLHYMDDYEDGAPVQVHGVYVNTWILTGMHRQSQAIGRSSGRPPYGSLRHIPVMLQMPIHWAGGGSKKNTSRHLPNRPTSTACEPSLPGSGLGFWIIHPPTCYWADLLD
jgi:hypothetical protein